MNYAVIQVTNGSFTVKSEHGDNKRAARVAFHTICAAIDNDAQFVGKACVKVVDDQLDCVDGLEALFVVEPAAEDVTE
jgi:hypothetical protein